MLTPREIIAEAWAITTKEKKLRRWGFISALFETTRNVELLLYQGFYLWAFLQGQRVGWFDVELLLLRNLPMWLFVIISIIMVILLIGQLLVPTFAAGPIIGLAAKSHRGEPVKGGLVLALYNFLALVELHGLFVLSSISISFTVISLAIRYLESDMRLFVIILTIIMWMISAFFAAISSFAEEAIVIDRDGVFRAVGRSVKMIMSNLTHIVFLLILMLVISLRIILNAVMILLIPGIIVGTAILLTSFFTPLISYIIAGIVGIILLIAASYLFAYLHVFKQTVWTLTYMELRTQKDLDIIIDEEEKASEPEQESTENNV